jgi:hypothetical protein
MNALIHTIEHIDSGIQLSASARKLMKNLALPVFLVAGFTAAATLAFLQSGLGAAESGRVLAALAAALGWIYLGLAMDEERISDALPDAVSFTLVTVFALLSLGGNAVFIAAAFGVHLVRALMRLAEGSQAATTQYGLLAWIGFAFGSVLVSLAGIV